MLKEWRKGTEINATPLLNLLRTSTQKGVCENDNPKKQKGDAATAAAAAAATPAPAAMLQLQL